MFIAHVKLKTRIIVIQKIEMKLTTYLISSAQNGNISFNLILKYEIFPTIIMMSLIKP